MMRSTNKLLNVNINIHINEVMQNIKYMYQFSQHPHITALATTAACLTRDVESLFFVELRLRLWG